MAAASMAMVSGASTVAAPLGLSSSATLGASQMAQLAPVGVGKSAGGRIVAVKASGEEESRSLTKQVVGAVVAAGVALRLAGAGMGASGPGGDGGERTAGKAGELLSQADASMKNGSPQRFGPEREFGNGTDKALLPEGWKWSNLRASGCHEYASVGVQAKGIEGSAPSTVAE